MTSASPLVTPGSSQRSRLARNTSWSLFGSVLSQGASLAAAMLVGRILGVTAFGQFAFLQSTILLFGSVSELGLSLTVTKYVSRWSVNQSQRAGNLIGSSLCIVGMSASIIAVLLGTISPRLPALGFQQNSVALAIACILLVFDTLNRVQSAALSGFEAFDVVARINAVRGALSLPAVWAGLVTGGLEGIFAGLTLVSMATLVFGHLRLRSLCVHKRIRLHYSFQLEREIYGTSFSLWASMLLLFSSTWAATLLLASHPSGGIQLGLFNAAEKWKAAVLFVPNMLFQVTLPMISQTYSAKGRLSASRIMLTSSLSATGVAIAGALFLWCFAGPLMSAYGREFSLGKTVLSAAAAVAVLNAMYTMGSSCLWAVGKPSAMLRIDLFRTAVLLFLCYCGFASSALRLNFAFLTSYAFGTAAILYSGFFYFRPTAEWPGE